MKFGNIIRRIFGVRHEPSPKKIWRYLASSRIEIALIRTERGAFWVSPQDQLIARLLFQDGDFETKSFDLMCRYLADLRLEKMIFLDIGANIGTHTIYAMRSGLFTEAISFEPAPENFRLLKKNIEENAVPATAVHMAVGSQEGVAHLELAAGKHGDNRIQATNTSGQEKFEESSRHIIDVPMTTLDGYLLHQKINPVRCFPHLDVQGYEASVLEGATSLLMSCPAMYAEFWPYGLRRASGLDRFMSLVTNSSSMFVHLDTPKVVLRPVEQLFTLDMSDNNSGNNILFLKNPIS